jgi:hypothetical protein
MIKAVVFDLGKVLLDFDYGIAARKIAERASMPANEIQRLIDGSPLLLRYESAQMNACQFFDEVRAHTGFTGSFEEFTATFADIFSRFHRWWRCTLDCANAASQRSFCPTQTTSRSDTFAETFRSSRISPATFFRTNTPC